MCVCRYIHTFIHTRIRIKELVISIAVLTTFSSDRIQVQLSPIRLWNHYRCSSRAFLADPDPARFWAGFRNDFWFDFGPRSHPGTSKGAPGATQELPRAPQEPPNTAPRPPHIAPTRPKSAHDHLKTARRCPKTPQRPPRSAPRPSWHRKKVSKKESKRIRKLEAHGC